MRVALIHDWLTGIRGGEKVLDALCDVFPAADLFTLVYVPGSTSPAIERRRIVRSRSSGCRPRRPGGASTCRSFRLRSSSSTSTATIWS